MMSSSAASYGSDLLSTGYLEDVLFQFRSKRRRLLVDDYRSSQLIDTSIKDYWTADLTQNCYHDFDFNTHHISEITKRERNSEMKTPEKEDLYCIDPIFSSGDDEKRKKGLLTNVVYPFALVKPGGFEGDITLNDINERILMPPTRPLRHPVGDFACRPLVSPDGPGLSGKAVVAFTKIHTHGKGTITIVRTRG